MTLREGGQLGDGTQLKEVRCCELPLKGAVSCHVFSSMSTMWPSSPQPRNSRTRDRGMNSEKRPQVSPAVSRVS